MKAIKINNGQTLIDIAIQELGDADKAMDIAVLNGISMTDELVAGSYVNVPDFDIDKKNIVKVFTDPVNKPASASGLDIEEFTPEGIEFWAIEIDFVVS